MKQIICTRRNKEVASGSKLKKQMLASGIKYRCNICDREPSRLDVDHVFPVFVGGASELINCQFLCHKCHLKKSLLDRKIISILKTAGFIERHGFYENICYIPLDRLRTYYGILWNDIRLAEQVRNAYNEDNTNI